MPNKIIINFKKTVHVDTIVEIPPGMTAESFKNALQFGGAAQEIIGDTYGYSDFEFLEGEFTTHHAPDDAELTSVIDSAEFDEAIRADYDDISNPES